MKKNPFKINISCWVDPSLFIIKDLTNELEENNQHLSQAMEDQESRKFKSRRFITNKYKINDFIENGIYTNYLFIN